jgi:glycosyltransferase involved in cell wall biosynthesis
MGGSVHRTYTRRGVPPKLTVITPSFNQGKFIERTIRSVLDQGYPNLEYVIVDGGSTDETLEIIRRYEDRLAWWVSEPDDGQSHAINKGLERTSGEIVAYLNSDDYYLPGALETAVGALERNGRSWVAGGAFDVEEGDHPKRLRVWRPKPPSYCEGRLRGRHWWMLVPWHVPQPSSFWRREVFEQLGTFRTDMHFAFDAEFMLRLAYADYLPELVPQPLSARVDHGESKHADMIPFYWEMDRFPALFRPVLTASERRRLAIVRFLMRAGFFRARERFYYPLLELGGNLLGLLPERIRPKIRDRDNPDRAHRGFAAATWEDRSVRTHDDARTAPLE